MKRIIVVLLLCLFLCVSSVSASLPLTGKMIVIDVGHGGVDAGTSFGNILEKDLNLAIALKLQNTLSKNGASVLMTRDGDYDLSSPNASRRKKSDFDNRIKLINDINPKLVISIHQNYYKDSKYKGTQIFYKDNKKLI